MPDSIYSSLPQYEELAQHSVNPVPEYLPAVQIEHTVFEELDVNVPSTQSIQATELEVETVFLPAGQSVQTLAVFAPVVFENMPEEQDKHALLPHNCLYFPALQAVHRPPLDPVYPKLH